MYERVVGVSPDEDIRNPSAFLYRLGCNLLLDDLRQRRRQGNRERAWADLQGMDAGGARASDMPTPETAVASRERLRRVLQAVETLPLQARRAFTLHKLEGLSHAETAARLGISKSGVEKHMSLALKLLAERVP